jgi:hypothetical protein
MRKWNNSDEKVKKKIVTCECTKMTLTNDKGSKKRPICQTTDASSGGSSVNADVLS